jgi:hypothetical protein
MPVRVTLPEVTKLLYVDPGVKLLADLITGLPLVIA